MNSARNLSAPRWSEKRHVYQEQDWSSNKQKFIKYSDVIGPIKSVVSLSPTLPTSIASSVSSTTLASTSSLAESSTLKYANNSTITRNSVTTADSIINAESQNKTFTTNALGSLNSTSDPSKNTILSLSTTTAINTQVMITSTHSNNSKDKTDVTSELYGVSPPSLKQQQPEDKKSFQNFGNTLSVSCPGSPKKLKKITAVSSVVNTPARQSKLLSAVTALSADIRVTRNNVNTPARQSKLLSVVSAISADVHHVTHSSVNTPARESKLLSIISTNPDTTSQITHNYNKTPARKSKLLSIISTTTTDTNQVRYNNINTPARNSKLLSIASILCADGNQKSEGASNEEGTRQISRTMFDPRIGSTGVRGNDKYTKPASDTDNYGKWARNSYVESRPCRNVPYLQPSTSIADPRIRSKYHDSARGLDLQTMPKRNRADSSHAYQADTISGIYNFKEYSRALAFRDSVAQYNDSERIYSANQVAHGRYQLRTSRSKHWSAKHENTDNVFFDSASGCSYPYMSDAGSKTCYVRSQYHPDFPFDDFNNGYNMDEWHSSAWNTSNENKLNLWARPFGTSSHWGGVITFHLHSYGNGKGNYVYIPETRMF